MNNKKITQEETDKILQELNEKRIKLSKEPKKYTNWIRYYLIGYIAVLVIGTVVILIPGNQLGYALVSLLTIPIASCLTGLTVDYIKFKKHENLIKEIRNLNNQATENKAILKKHQIEKEINNVKTQTITPIDHSLDEINEKPLVLTKTK